MKNIEETLRFVGSERKVAIAVALTALLTFTLGLTESAPASIYLNEAVVRGADRVELYNSGPGAVVLTDWTIQGNLGVFVISDTTALAVGEYRTIGGFGDIFPPIGGEILVIDAANQLRDGVQYGNAGGAPLPHDTAQVSLSRAPDASALPPLDPANDAIDWTLDLTSTFGAANDVQPAALGTSLRINELRPSPSGGLLGDADQIELYNPTGAPIVAFEWFVTTGASGTVLLTDSTPIPAGGFRVVELPLSNQLEDTELVYLFTDAGVRVDQVGFFGFLARLPGDESCLGRCPDGAGPTDGYDFETTGGGDSFFPDVCSIGESNGDLMTCGEPTPVEQRSWGGLKAVFR